jgi:hypothetical protein
MVLMFFFEMKNEWNAIGLVGSGGRESSRHIDKESAEKTESISGTAKNGVERNLWSRTWWPRSVRELEKDLVKISMLQEVLAKGWPNHRIRPYGPCAIFGYKTERHPFGFLQWTPLPPSQKKKKNNYVFDFYYGCGVQGSSSAGSAGVGVEGTGGSGGSRTMLGGGEDMGGGRIEGVGRVREERKRGGRKKGAGGGTKNAGRSWMVAGRRAKMAGGGSKAGAGGPPKSYRGVMGGGRQRRSNRTSGPGGW